MNMTMNEAVNPRPNGAAADLVARPAWVDDRSQKVPAVWLAAAQKIYHAPEAFGEMLRQERRRLGLSLEELCDAFAQRVGEKTVGKTKRFDGSAFSIWERGLLGKRHTVSMLARWAWYFLAFHGWTPEEVTDKLKVVRTPPLAVAHTTRSKAAPKKPESTALAESFESLLASVVAAVGNYPPKARGKLEDELLKLVGVDIDLMSMLRAGLAKLPESEQAMTLVRMHHLTTTARG